MGVAYLPYHKVHKKGLVQDLRTENCKEKKDGNFIRNFRKFNFLFKYLFKVILYNYPLDIILCRISP